MGSIDPMPARQEMETLSAWHEDGRSASGYPILILEIRGIRGLVRVASSLPSYALMTSLARGLPSEFSGALPKDSEFPHAKAARVA